MKFLTAISMFFFVTLAVVVTLESFGIIEIQNCLVEFAEEGNSENESSENSEDDSENDSFYLNKITTSKLPKDPINGRSKNSIAGHFIEIPVPPPEFI